MAPAARSWPGRALWGPGRPAPGCRAGRPRPGARPSSGRASPAAGHTAGSPPGDPRPPPAGTGRGGAAARGRTSAPRPPAGRATCSRCWWRASAWWSRRGAPRPGPGPRPARSPATACRSRAARCPRQAPVSPGSRCARCRTAPAAWLPSYGHSSDGGAGSPSPHREGAGLARDRPGALAVQAVGGSTAARRLAAGSRCPAQPGNGRPSGKVCATTRGGAGDRPGAGAAPARCVVRGRRA